VRRGEKRQIFGGIGRILRELSDFINQFSNLLFEFNDAMNIELFFLGIQILPSSLPTGLLSDKFRVLLEKNIDMPP